MIDFGSLDIFMPNADELLAITGTATIEAGLQAFHGEVDTVIVKAGAEGAYTRCAGTISHHPGVATNVMDTTTAGDCFNAGFLGAWCSGAPFDDAIAAGNAGGARAVACVGLPEK